MEIEEYKKQKLGELKRHFASEEQALEKKGYHLSFDVFSEPFFDEKGEEMGRNIFLEVTIVPPFLEDKKLMYYHILCENFGQESEVFHEMESFIFQLQVDMQKIIMGGVKAFKRIFNYRQSPFRLSVWQVVLILSLIGIIGFLLIYIR